MTEENIKFAPKQSATATRWCVLEADDADEQAHNLKAWQQQFDQISMGQFYGRIEEVMFEHVHAFREHTSRAIRQQCNVWPNAIWMGFSADEKSCRINGHQVEKNQLMIRPGNTQFELITPEDFDIYGLVVNQDSLQLVAEKQGIKLDSHALNSPLKVWESHKLNQLRHVLNDVISPAQSDISRRIQEDNLMMAMLEVLQQNGPSTEKPSFSKRRAVVEKVTAYLDANPSKHVTITELCDLAHVSRRTLQYSFEDVLDISPVKFIRMARLNAVRRRLLQGLQEDETIAMVAQHWGFTHAGQFTHDYTELFGENPSMTISRRHN